MPSFKDYQRLLNRMGKTSGQAKRVQSEIVLEASWNEDIQSKVCYIYDYYHDNEKDKCVGLNPTEDPLKTKIDAKFVITQYGSLSKDQVEYHLLFKPSHVCELEYFEKEYAKRYDAEYPIGLYIDIPDEKGVYRKWMICGRDYDQQFVNYSILPCNYKFQWIYDNKKYNIWGIARLRNSYNSGVWRDYVFETVENQDQIWLPQNPITDTLYYNQRIIVSAKIKQPIVWHISKVEGIHPLGIAKLTLAQDKFDPATDYVNLDTGEMYASYYASAIEPKDTDIVPEENITDYSSISYSGKSAVLKIGGGYKTLTATFYDQEGNVINTHSSIWSFYIDGNDALEYITILKSEESPEKIKIKIIDNDVLLGKILTVQLSDESGNCVSNIEFEILSL